MMRYDLRGLRNLPFLKARRVNRWIGTSLAALFGFVAVYGVVGYFVQHGRDPPWQSTALILLIPLVLGGAALVWVIVSGFDDDFMDVGSEGLMLIRSNRVITRWLWSDPRLVLTVQLTNGIGRGGAQAPPMIFVTGSRPPQRYLTREAYEALLLEAPRHGLQIISDPSDLYPGWTRTVICRPSESSPLAGAGSIGSPG